MSPQVAHATTRWSSSFRFERLPDGGFGLSAGNRVAQGVRVLQASGELFGRRSAVSPGVMYPGGQLLARGGGCSTRLIRRIQATPASEQDICIDVTYLSPDWRADSSKATTVRIYNRVDDKQLDCVR
jgi:hypothetical protein